jgi:predicted nucleic acid-binding protein
MATPVADRAILDTNVLLAATDEAREDHEDAIAAINLWPASGVVLYTSGQILREYLAVATRPSTATAWAWGSQTRLPTSERYGRD